MAGTKSIFLLWFNHLIPHISMCVFGRLGRNLQSTWSWIHEHHTNNLQDHKIYCCHLCGWVSSLWALITLVAIVSLMTPEVTPSLLRLRGTSCAPLDSVPWLGNTLSVMDQHYLKQRTMEYQEKTSYSPSSRSWSSFSPPPIFSFTSL